MTKPRLMMNGLVWAGLGVVALTSIASSAVAAQVRIVDGDTLELDGVRHRLHGIDAPEAGQLCKGSHGGSWRCGDEATQHLLRLVGSSVPLCDDRGHDAYDRIISVCIIDGAELNRAMVADGFAWAFRRYSMDYAAAEDAAKARHLEIWQRPSQTPWDYRAAKWTTAEQDAPRGCPIKGNVSKNGKIYHLPWSPWYSRTKVSPEAGERWFCSEREAIDAGWRGPIWGN